MYLIYRRDIGEVVEVQKEKPVELKDGVSYIKIHTFTSINLKEYDITVREDETVLSVLKPIGERKAIQLEEENQQQGAELSEREIQETIQGMQISELEIQLLELQLGGI
ncbi:hypothetical protein [Anaerovorax odorimutans]|uniref:hypothetical protein n=1 Tax=Anaerovorax odorimutans TaxID=109327 RepID=UPI0003F55530|nr:hypothetical protein [Anaerovorax odorimutans]